MKRHSLVPSLLRSLLLESPKVIFQVIQPLEGPTAARRDVPRRLPDAARSLSRIKLRPGFPRDFVVLGVVHRPAELPIKLLKGVKISRDDKENKMSGRSTLSKKTFAFTSCKPA